MWRQAAPLFVLPAFSHSPSSCVHLRRRPAQGLAAASTCRSRWASWPQRPDRRPAASRPRVRGRALALGRAAAGARGAGDQPGLALGRRPALPSAAARQRRRGGPGPGAQVVRAQHLLDVVRQFPPERRDGGPEPAPADGWLRLAAQAPETGACCPDLADMRGQAGVRRALETVAAGGHSLLFCGPIRPSQGQGRGPAQDHTPTEDWHRCSS
jgi:hypothetical protein